MIMINSSILYQMISLQFQSMTRTVPLYIKQREIMKKNTLLCTLSALVLVHFTSARSCPKRFPTVAPINEMQTSVLTNNGGPGNGGPVNGGPVTIDSFRQYIIGLEAYNGYGSDDVKNYVTNIKPRFETLLEIYHLWKNTISGWCDAANSVQGDNASMLSAIREVRGPLGRLGEDLNTNFNNCFLSNHMRRKESRVLGVNDPNFSREQFRNAINDVKREVENEIDKVRQMKNALNNDSTGAALAKCRNMVI